MRIQQFAKAFKSRKGYVLLTVLCIFLVFVVLGTNMLIAAYATVGASSKKYTDSQAYLLASSALKPLAAEIEKGSFQTQIDNLITQVKTALAASTSTSACSVTLNSDAFSFSTSAEKATLSITFHLNDAAYEKKADGTDDAANITGTLEARVSATYGASQYAFIADFSQLYGATPGTKIWKLRSYRSVRGSNIPFTPSGGPS